MFSIDECISSDESNLRLLLKDVPGAVGKDNQRRRGDSYCRKEEKKGI